MNHKGNCWVPTQRYICQGIFYLIYKISHDFSKPFIHVFMIYMFWFSISRISNPNNGLFHIAFCKKILCGRKKIPFLWVSHIQVDLPKYIPRLHPISCFPTFSSIVSNHFLPKAIFTCWFHLANKTNPQLGTGLAVKWSSPQDINRFVLHLAALMRHIK